MSTNGSFQFQVKETGAKEVTDLLVDRLAELGESLYKVTGVTIALNEASDAYVTTAKAVTKSGKDVTAVLKNQAEAGISFNTTFKESSAILKSLNNQFQRTETDANKFRKALDNAFQFPTSLKKTKDKILNELTELYQKGGIISDQLASSFSKGKIGKDSFLTEVMKTSNPLIRQLETINTRVQYAKQETDKLYSQTPQGNAIQYKKLVHDIGEELLKVGRVDLSNLAKLDHTQTDPTYRNLQSIVQRLDELKSKADAARSANASLVGSNPKSPNYQAADPANQQAVSTKFTKLVEQADKAQVNLQKLVDNYQLGGQRYFDSLNSEQQKLLNTYRELLTLTSKLQVSNQGFNVGPATDPANQDRVDKLVTSLRAKADKANVDINQVINSANTSGYFNNASKEIRELITDFKTLTKVINEVPKETKITNAAKAGANLTGNNNLPVPYAIDPANQQKVNTQFLSLLKAADSKEISLQKLIANYTKGGAKYYQTLSNEQKLLIDRLEKILALVNKVAKAPQPKAGLTPESNDFIKTQRTKVSSKAAMAELGSLATYLSKLTEKQQSEFHKAFKNIKENGVKAFSDINDANARFYKKSVQYLRALEKEQRAATIGLDLTSIIKLGAIQNLHFLISGIIRQTQEMIQEFIELDIRISQIQSIQGESERSAESWRKEIEKLSSAYARNIKDVADGTYEALSNQVIEAANSYAFMNQALILSVTTASTTKDAVNLLSSSLNSYQESVIMASVHSAIFFKGIEVGRFVASDLANSWGVSSSLAAQLGISMTELNTSLALFTRQGLTTAVSQTLLGNIMQKLLSPTKEMQEWFAKIGVSSGEMAVRTYGLIGIFKLLGKELRENGGNKLADLFNTMRGTRGILAAVQDIKTYNDALAEIGGIGNTEKEIRENLTRISEEFKRANTLVDRSVGQQVSQIMTELKNLFLTDVINDIINDLLKFDKSIGGTVNAAKDMVSVLRELYKAISPVIGLMASTIGAMREFEVAGVKVNLILMALTAVIVRWKIAWTAMAAPKILAFLYAVPGALVGIAGGLKTVGVTAAGLTGGLGAIIVVLTSLGYVASAFYKSSIFDEEKLATLVNETNKVYSDRATALNESMAIEIEVAKRLQDLKTKQLGEYFAELNRRITDAENSSIPINFEGNFEDFEKALSETVTRSNERIKEFQKLAVDINDIQFTNIKDIQDFLDDSVKEAESLKKEADKTFDKALQDVKELQDKITSMSLSDESKRFKRELDNLSPLRQEAALRERIAKLIAEAQKATPEVAKTKLDEAEALAGDLYSKSKTKTKRRNLEPIFKEIDDAQISAVKSENSTNFSKAEVDKKDAEQKFNEAKKQQLGIEQQINDKLKEQIEINRQLNEVRKTGQDIQAAEQEAVKAHQAAVKEYADSQASLDQPTSNLLSQVSNDISEGDKNSRFKTSGQDLRNQLKAIIDNVNNLNLSPLERAKKLSAEIGSLTKNNKKFSGVTGYDLSDSEKQLKELNKLIKKAEEAEKSAASTRGQLNETNSLVQQYATVNDYVKDQVTTEETINQKLRERIELLKRIEGVVPPADPPGKATGGILGQDTRTIRVSHGEMVLNNRAVRAYRPVLERMNSVSNVANNNNNFNINASNAFDVKSLSTQLIREFRFALREGRVS